MHMTAHSLSMTMTATSNKIPKLKAPTLTEECSETDWNQFQIQWDWFKCNTGLAGQDLIDQLWGCLLDSLEKAGINDGANSCIEEVKLLKRIKKLAVKGQNLMVNRTMFITMGQERNEPVTAFVAQLCGQSKLCIFNMT